MKGSYACGDTSIGADSISFVRYVSLNQEIFETSISDNIFGQEAIGNNSSPHCVFEPTKKIFPNSSLEKSS